jgi:hypothetical protein
VLRLRDQRPATKTFTNQVVTFLYLAYRMAGKDARELDAFPI